MDFYINSAENISFTVDEAVLKRVQHNEFGNQKGLSVVSFYQEYDKNVLSVLTNIKYVALSRPEVYVVADGEFISTFTFENDNLLTSGVSQEAIDALTKCTHLAQAQSYAVFSLLSTENKVPLAPMETTPVSNFIEGLQTFLKEYQLSSN
ncbi:hypothetical protein [Dyadobacter diqingensis]|uniref:hypothetical protein n=1 Tax=Dyadobacter diqingensis TaxID=2938121 RepID=UPI0020C2FD48|nr:hypothetical protein [Dyadobacter diqingensis]